jgi:hypothetical protein
MGDDREVIALLDATGELLEALRRLTLLTERLAARASLDGYRVLAIAAAFTAEVGR